jgi:hypothetical protein
MIVPVITVFHAGQQSSGPQAGGRNLVRCPGVYEGQNRVQSKTGHTALRPNKLSLKKTHTGPKACTIVATIHCNNISVPTPRYGENAQ